MGEKKKEDEKVDAFFSITSFNSTLKPISEEIYGDTEVLPGYFPVQHTVRNLLKQGVGVDDLQWSLSTSMIL